jgi:hypothetical protein
MINQEQLAKRLYDAIQGCAQNFPTGLGAVPIKSKEI